MHATQIHPRGPAAAPRKNPANPLLRVLPMHPPTTAETTDESVTMNRTGNNNSILPPFISEPPGPRSGQLRAPTFVAGPAVAGLPAQGIARRL